MQKTAQVFAGLAGLIHVLFFVLESILWGSPAANKTFHLTAVQAKTTQLMAFNQGFYNLFLAFGVFVGVYLLFKGATKIGGTLLVFSCLCMVGASLVLLYSAPNMLRGVLMQGGFSSLAVIFFFLSTRKEASSS